MKHKLHSTAAVLLLLMLTWSCTAYEEPVPASVASAPDGLSITVGSRPAYAAGATLPATRAAQTPDGTAAEWETGDVLWLDVHFAWTPAGEAQSEKSYISAIRYNGTEWLPLTVQESFHLNTSGIQPGTGPDGTDYCGFARRPKWPAQALADGTTGAKVQLKAYFLGNGIPHDGILAMDYSTDLMAATSNWLSPDDAIDLSLQHTCTRLSITDEAELSLAQIRHFAEWDLSVMTGREPAESTISIADASGYYFVTLSEDSEVLLDSHTYTLAPGSIDGAGKKVYNGYAYTLALPKHGEVTPGDMQKDE